MTKDKLIAWLDSVEADNLDAEETLQEMFDPDMEFVEIDAATAAKTMLEQSQKLLKLTRIVRHLWEANDYYAATRDMWSRPETHGTIFNIAGPTDVELVDGYQICGKRARAAKQKVLEEIE